MADAIVSKLLEHLTSIALKQAEQEVRLVVGVKEEVNKLTSNLHAIQAVLEDAERRQVKEATVKQWLRKLKDVLYDMDDVLDEWSTAMLKMQTKRDENALMPKRKVCSLFPSSCFCFRQVALRHEIAVKIKKINKTLDVISIEKERYNFTLMRGVEELERQITASSVDVSEVHGRDQDKNTIIEMLLNESSEEPTLRIISIVGMGGIGKTTLAQLVYNDGVVNAHFPIRIWVCVSDPFDEIRISKAILEALKKDAPNLNELDSLLLSIRDVIENKKFILVLDDVWTEDYKRFEQLKSSLKCGLPGSRILVTTRKETVAKTMGTTDMFRLGQLSNEECWLLFSQVAFFGRRSEECEKLKDIGQGIAKKCNSLPLAAKVLGSFLRFKNTREEWQNVLNSEIWELEEVEKSISPSLLFSYYDLSSTIRLCFSYCAIFPKDYKIKKDRLIKLWMAQGFFRETPNRDMEMVGEECFNNLVMRSFFQDFEKDNDGRIIICKMHDIVHDFAQYLTENECFVMEVNSPQESRLDSSYIKAHHLMILHAKTVPIPASLYNVKNLRSIIVESKDLSMINAALPKLFDQLTCLRTLDLSSSNHHLFYYESLEQLPREVGKLIHLRYLNLAHNNKLEKLPEEVSDLCNLQSLNLCCCASLKKLPRGLGNLINLRHLELSNTSNLGFMPRGIDRLSCLRTLDSFVVSSDDNVNEASTLQDLKNLNHLRGSLNIIGLGRVRDVSEAKEAQLLYNKKHLLSLVLHFGYDFNYEEDFGEEEGDFGEEEGEGRMRNDEEVIEALQPPPNLEILEIYDYRGTVLPDWMIPCLRKLRILRCPNLKALPDHLLQTTSLEELEIYDCPILEERYHWMAGEDRDKFGHIPITEINGMTTRLRDMDFGSMPRPFYVDFWDERECANRRTAESEKSEADSTKAEW